MIPKQCPECKRVHYWNRELDFHAEGKGVIFERGVCDAPDCNHKTKWFTFICKEVKHGK